MNAVPARPVPAIVLGQIDNFGRWQRVWFAVHYTCGLAGVIAGVMAAAFRQGAEPGVVPWGLVFGMTAAVATAAVTFLGPQQRGESYKHAYFRLLHAVARFELVPRTTEDWLLAELQAAQEIVTSGDVAPRTSVPAAPVPQDPLPRHAQPRA